MQYKQQNVEACKRLKKVQVPDFVTRIYIFTKTPANKTPTRS